jgi:predicted dehydrogenase
MIRIGIIGCGQISRHHAATYRKIPDAQMVICADIDPAVATRYASDFEIPEWTTDFREILRRDDIDAVDVCLHNNLHLPATVEALRAGKNVYCEKPMAGSYRDALTMLETARETGRHLHIQLSTLYTNETIAARELIAQGELGSLYHARSTGWRRRGRPFVDGYGSPTFVQKQFSAGGAMYDMGVYHISQILFLLGNPKVERISGKTYQRIAMDDRRRESSGYNVEELAVGFVRFEGEVTLDIIEAWAVLLDKFEGSSIIGDKGGVRLNPFGFFRSAGALDLDATVDLDAMRYKLDNVRGDAGLYRDSQSHWIAALEGRTELWPTAEVALNTMLISEGVYLSDALRSEVSADEVAAASVSSAVVI